MSMESITEANEATSYPEVFHSQPPKVTVKSSSHIQVGNSLSYQAPVTFNVDVMNMQGTKLIPQTISKRSSIIIILVVTFCTIVLTSVLVFFTKHKDNVGKILEDPTTENIVTSSSSPETTSSLPRTLPQTTTAPITKKPFPQLPVRVFRKLKLPVKTVIVNYRCSYPKYLFCYTKADCSSKINYIKNYDIQDVRYIRYNFLMAPDGHVFEGMGWYNKTAAYESAYDICFLQNNSVSHITSNQIKSTEVLIKNGIQNGNIEKDYILYDQYELVNGLRDPNLLLHTTKQLPGYKEALKIYRTFEWRTRYPQVLDSCSSPGNFSTIIITHIPEYKTCDTFKSCSDVMNELQDFDACWLNCKQNFTGLQLIRYNYVLGGNGLLFEGRGFSCNGDLVDDTNLNTTFLNFGFIGNFTGKVPDQTTFNAFFAFIDQYQHLEKLDSNLQIDAHSHLSDANNQFMKTFFTSFQKWHL